MTFLGYIFMIIGIINLFFNPIGAGILVVIAIVCFKFGNNNNTSTVDNSYRDIKINSYEEKQEKINQENIELDKHKAKEKRVWLAKKTKEIMENKNISIIEAKEEAEMEYIIEHEG